MHMHECKWMREFTCTQGCAHSHVGGCDELTACSHVQRCKGALWCEHAQVFGSLRLSL